MKKYAIIVAAGKGKRTGLIFPKQFFKINNKPIICYTIEKFLEVKNIEIILVVSNNKNWQKIINNYRNCTNLSIVKGGKNRFDSVKNALKSLKNKGIVAIHDGVRPLISKKLIENLFKSALKKNNAIPYIDLKDSIRKVDDNKNKSLKRENYVLIQTPQVFHNSDIKKAYNQKFDKKFTDDANVFESLNKKINLIKGEEKNFKITTKNDLKLAEKYLGN